MKTFYAIDFETANYNPVSACAVGIVRFENGVESDSMYSLIRPPEMDFEQDLTDVHHINANDVRDSLPFWKVWAFRISPFINRLGEDDIQLVAHNAAFDENIIRACCEYYRMTVPNVKITDIYRMARTALPNLDSYRLGSLAEQFGIEYDAHNALDDARTCGRIYAMAMGNS